MNGTALHLLALTSIASMGDAMRPVGRGVGVQPASDGRRFMQDEEDEARIARCKARAEEKRRAKRLKRLKLAAQAA